MINDEWPISPTFLSLRENCHEDTIKCNRDGIYYPDYLRGFIADLSRDKSIQNALSLFQFVPADFKPLDTNSGEGVSIIWNEHIEAKIKSILGDRKIIRIDSGTFIQNGRICDSFRDCGYKANCFKNDSNVAIFAKEVLNNYDPNTTEYLEELKSIICDINNDKEIKNKIKWEEYDSNNTKRFYIHYTCPYSLFEEYVFPIYSQGRLIACLMLGQLARENFDKEECFADYRHEMSTYIDIEKTVETIKVLDNTKWNKRLDTIISRIETFEERLTEHINSKNTTYINTKFEEIEHQFREGVRNISIKKQNITSKFSYILNNAFDNIRKYFDVGNDGFISMFAIPIDISHNELFPIGWSGFSFDGKDKVQYSFSFKQLKGLDESESKHNDLILAAASEPIRKKYDFNKDVFFYRKQVDEEVAYIVWKRHSSKLMKYKNEKYFDEYKKALRNFYSLVFECYSYTHEERIKLLLETIIRECAHESAHFILPAIDILDKHINMVPAQMINRTDLKHYYNYELIPFENNKNKIKELLYQLKDIYIRPPIIFSDNLQIKKEYKSITLLFYKLRDMREERAKDSHKSIQYGNININEEIKLDEAYFSHAIFNLLDNAIKYGFDGSNIYIKINVDKQNDRLIIQIVSYGIEIKKEDKIYNLWERGDKASSMAQGEGIGMYIVKKICEAHNGTITHKSELLSIYNIPVLFNYKYKRELAKDFSQEEIKQFDYEIERLSKSTETEVVNDHKYINYAYVFATRIKEPTFRNTFIITLPLH